MVTVPEDIGMIELCANLTNGTLMRDAVVNVVYVEETAIGKYIYSI